MPTFPTYDGELPNCLNPLNPRHYLLVLYWVFFRPTALNYYLFHEEILEFLPSSSIGSFIDLPHFLRQEKFTKLFSIIAILTAMSILVPGILKYCIESRFNLLVIISDIENLGNIFLISGITLITGLLVFTLTPLSEIPSNFLAPAKFFAVPTTISFLVGVEVLISIAPIPYGPMFGALILFGIFLSTICSPRSSLLFSLAIGIFLCLISFPEFNFLSLKIGCSVFLLLCMGALRIPFYVLEIIIVLLQKEKFSKTHPILWDEFSVLPLLFSRGFLSWQLQYFPQKGLRNLAQIISNPFQAWVVQITAWSHLAESGSPIEQIYILATAEELNRYAQVSTTFNEWRGNISSREMIFAELSGVSLSNSGRVVSGLNNIPRLLTNGLRCKPSQSLREVIILFLLHLVPEETDVRKLLKVLQHNSRIQFDLTLDNYIYGQEVRESFNAISAYLQFQTPQDIATAPTHLTWLNPTDTFLRPTVIQALQILSTISQSVHRANIASSPINQRNAILIANDSLEQLTTYVTEQVHPNYPEQKLLLRIIDQWQSIITKAGGELGRAELLEPIENPYIAGPPVTGHLFVGREDILTQLEELWLRPGQVESVVLYGHRRMGKTSILRNLPGRLTPTTHIINFNIQTLGTLNTAQLILALAQTLYDDLPAHIHIPEPQATDFPTPEPDFRRWLKKLETHRRPDDRFIIAIDEFELIEQGIKDGRLSQSLIGHWRGILNDFPWIIFAFAGLHTLQEMTQDYWNPLFGSVRKIPLTFLTQPAATRLITNPSEDFPIDYDPDAIDRIYHLTHGQPYLTQLICQNLITRFNRQRFEEQREIEPRFTIADVQTIITEPNFFNDGNAYFRGIWEQAQETQGPAQLAILQNLTDRPLTQHELADRTNLPPDMLDRALKLLIEHDVIQPNDQTQYHYRVELMRQWVARRS